MKRILVTFAFLCGLSAVLPAPSLAVSACNPLPGADALIGPDGPAFVIFGEAHGTEELPEAFADLVCAFAVARVPLTVGLEFLPDEQAMLETYLGSDGTPAARAALLAAPGWSDRHGRASDAILATLDTLRRLKASGADIAVAAFDHPSEQPGTSAAREEGMARNLLAAWRMRPQARVVALTGIGHAGKSPWTSLGPPFRAMSQHLPEDRTVALAFVRGGGAVWACRASAESAAEDCRAWPAAAREPIPARGLVMSRERNGFDGIVSVGRPYTASPPAREMR